MKTKRFRRLLAMVFVLVGIAEMSGVSRADFAIDTGNNPQIDENVLLNNNSTGNTVFGTINQTGLTVGFTSAAQVLLAPSNGQARTEANDGSNLLGLDSIFVVDGSYTSLIFNMFDGDGATTTITVDGFDAMNNA